MEEIEMVIPPREKDLGGFSVRRLLPCSSHPMVGPFIFFDHMGPAVFKPGEGIDVRPHPHINLATVTYLFEGKIRHRDNLGTDQLIEPGAINWMTAGKGIVHSERSPEEARAMGSKLSGIQCWVALPTEHEDTTPSFSHHPKSALPEFQLDGVKLKLLLGNLFNHRSPVPLLSDLFYLDVQMSVGASFTLPADGRDCAIYLVSGKLRVSSQLVEPYNMAIIKKCQRVQINAIAESRLMLLGGKTLGNRYIYWNFVSSSLDKIEEAKKEWANGPSNTGRFAKIPDDDSEFIPLPDETPNPKGTIM